MARLTHLLIAAPSALVGQAAAQEAAGPSPSDLVLLFSVAVAVVAGIAIYISREALLGRKTDYEKSDFDSQRDRDFEKYHSDWGEEYPRSSGRKRAKWDPPEGGLPDYYGVLGLERGATRGEIKKRYRELAKEEHPDRTGDPSTGRMAEINEAYEVLSDDDKREQYDGMLEP
ncbi:DnaJ-class molecular chaperone [Cenarchaeum symbiosum A]|uniref:DnaJ-class molecular chaperone n=1 Tax=Cenarchaeum symbiosum (strain A) TaxID=414004 RepID=A0RYK5_CENSY|nr:DnaJ-class molecular chaperone [Cenarchaeum symbiosum A]